MVDKQHGTTIAGDGPLGVDGIHIAHNYTFANIAAQNAEAIDAEDVGKICYRTDLPGFFIAVAVGTGFQFWRRIDSQQTLSSNQFQVAHGFAVGDAIFSSNATFSKAQADDFGTQASGLVGLVPDVDSFTIVTQGGFFQIGHGFTVDAVLYTSPDVAGELTETKPLLEGQLTNPIGFAFDANTMIVISGNAESDPELAERYIGRSNTSASALSTNHALQAGDGTDQHIKIGGIVIGCYNGSNNPTAMDYDALRVRLNTNSSTPWQFRNPDDIALASNYNCRTQYFSNVGGTLRGEIGFQGSFGFVFRNFQTNTERGGFLFEIADATRFVSMPRLITIVSAVATLSSNTHPFQVGENGNERTAFSANKMLAIDTGGSLTSFDLECTQLDTGTLNLTSAVNAFVVPRIVNEAAVANVADGAIFYDTTANAFKFREDGVWVTGSGLA